MKTRKMLLGAVGMALCISIKATPQTAEHFSFEVASVKPNKPEPNKPKVEVMQDMSLRYLPGGRLSVRAVPIPVLIFEAYSVAPGPGRRISLSPAFEKSMDYALESETYNIEAVAEKGAIPPNASVKEQRQKIRLMLQTLLTDRFKVRITRETKEVPIYAIAIGTKGPKLQKSTIDDAQCAATSADKPEIRRYFASIDPSSCHSFFGGVGRGLRGEAVTMSDLAQALEGSSDRPVVDQTGLRDLYKMDIPGWTPLRAPSPEPTGEDRVLFDPARPTLSNVLQGLGLKLDSTRAPIEIFVVEHFERPMEN